MVVGAMAMVSWSIGESHAETRATLALSPGHTDDPTVFYIPPNHLMEVYLSRAVDDHEGFTSSAQAPEDAPYDWRAGVNYHLSSGFSLHADARHRKLETSFPIGEESSHSSLGIEAKPWEIRFGFSYRWGSGR